MGMLRVMSKTMGDESVVWEVTDTESVTRAQAQFEEMINSGWAGFAKPDESTTEAEMITVFDPNAHTIVVVPQLVGG